MSITDSSLYWALNRFGPQLSSSYTTSLNIPDHAFLTNLLRSPLPNGNTKIQPKMSRLSPSALHQLKEGISAAQRLRNACEASGRVNYDEFRRMKAVWDTVQAEKTRVWAESEFAGLRAIVEGDILTSSVTKKKPGFNHEYTPLLEKYFEFNAYPSAADRAVLARKCMMTARQIEVWFQNHRNRAKKEGKTLRRLTDQPFPADITLDRALKTLERKMPYFVIPADERQVNKPKDSQVEAAHIEDDMQPMPVSQMPHTPLFSDHPMPSHVFPTVYTFNGSNPLDAQSKVYTFAAPVWQRKPASPTQRPKIPIDMDEFINEFNQKLHLRAPATRARHPLSQPWYASRFTVPCSAPHPALLRSSSPYVSRPFSMSPFPDISLRSSRRRAFRSPTPSSQPSTLIPPQNPKAGPSRRKIARLPRRSPTCATRQTTPAVTETSSRSPSPSSSQTSSSSRKSSFGSEFSSRRRSSSSSVSSIPSSALTTPVGSHIELPGEVFSPSVGPGYRPDKRDGPAVRSSSGKKKLSNHVSPPTKR